MNHNINLTCKLFETVAKSRHSGKVVKRNVAFMKKERADYIIYT
jgi:hypothetical protein